MSCIYPCIYVANDELPSSSGIQRNSTHMVDGLGWQVREATGPTHGRTSNHIRVLAISVKVYSILRAKYSSICLSVTPFLHIVCSMYYALSLLFHATSFSLSPTLYTPSSLYIPSSLPPTPSSLFPPPYFLLHLPSSPPYIPSSLTPTPPPSPPYSLLTTSHPLPSSPSYSLLTTSCPIPPPPHTQTFWLPMSSQSHKMLYLESGTYCKTNDDQNESTNHALSGTCTRWQPSPPIHTTTFSLTSKCIAIRKHVYDEQ